MRCAIVKFARFSLVITCCLLGIVNSGRAQPRPGYEPSATHIYPAGARRGTTVDLRVGSECLPPFARFQMFGEKFNLQTILKERVQSPGEPSPRRRPTEEPITYPREWKSRVSIPITMPTGVISWRLSCAQGGTPTRPFLIGDLPEYLEKESNSTLENANRVELPVTVNGHIHGERDLDFFRFSAKPGDVVVCEILAARLQSRLDPVFRIFDGDGQPVSTEVIYIHQDPVVAFRANSQGDYYCCISNVSHRGDPAHVYRINISTRPFVRFVFPSGGQAGTTGELEIHQMSGTDKPNVVSRTVTFPIGNESAFVLHDENNRRTWMHRMKLSVNQHRNLRETKANESQKTATEIPVPVTLHGRLSTPTDQDWYHFQPKKGKRYEIVCTSASGSRSYPTLQLVDGTGQQIKLLRSIDNDRRECRLEWQAADDNPLFLRIRDQQYGAQGGRDFSYRLTIQPAIENFSVNITSSSFSVLPGKELRIPVTVLRTGGFNQPVTLKIPKLPKGISAKPLVVPGNKTSGSIRLKIADSARVGDSRFQVSASAKIAGKTQTKYATVEGAALLGHPEKSEFHLTVRHPPVFRLFCSEAYLYAHRGSVFLYPMEIERLNNFQGKITLQIGDRQNRDLDGIQMFEVTVPPGKSEIDLPIYLPETMHINIQSQSQLYSQAYAIFTDKHGKRQSVLVLSEKRNMLRTLPPVVKLKSVTEAVNAKPGSTVSCRLKLERTSNFPGPMTVQLLPTPGFSARPVTFKARQTKVEIPVVVNQSVEAKTTQLKFRAAGKMQNGTQIYSETTVEVRLQ
ncbi:MAG: hypothetical protein Tsb009_10720 [Planctomycetaceae bacterium]